MGTPARSWLGWQLPIRTEEAHARARIADIDTGALAAAMAKGEVAVIPGFQGLMDDGRVSTLGRGGSDTSAVAVAAALKADRCDIYTDVDGVYTTDPRIVARARKLDYVTYEEMLELASVGAKVLQTRSVGLAMKEGVRVQVLSSFVEGDEAPATGTMIVSDEEIEEHQMERQLITGIAHDKNEAKVIVTRVPDKPGAVANIFGLLAAAGINVDMIIQNVGREKGETDVTFTVPATDLLRSIDLLEGSKDKIGFNRIISDDKVAKISVVGVGMKSHAGVASTMFRALADRGINIQAISTSEIKVSVLIDEDETELRGARPPHRLRARRRLGYSAASGCSSPPARRRSRACVMMCTTAMWTANRPNFDASGKIPMNSGHQAVKKSAMTRLSPALANISVAQITPNRSMTSPTIASCSGGI